MTEPDEIIIDDEEVVAMAEALAKRLGCSPEQAVHQALVDRACELGLLDDDRVA